MTSVSCSSVLNRALAQGVKSGAVTGGSDNVRLGDWAAQLAGREFVVAIAVDSSIVHLAFPRYFRINARTDARSRAPVRIGNFVVSTSAAHAGSIRKASSRCTRA